MGKSSGLRYWFSMEPMAFIWCLRLLLWLIWCWLQVMSHQSDYEAGRWYIIKSQTEDELFRSDHTRRNDVTGCKRKLDKKDFLTDDVTSNDERRRGKLFFWSAESIQEGRRWQQTKSKTCSEDVRIWCELTEREKGTCCWWWCWYQLLKYQSAFLMSWLLMRGGGGGSEKQRERGADAGTSTQSAGSRHKLFWYSRLLPKSLWSPPENGISL